MITLIYGPGGENVNDFNYQVWIDSLIITDWANKDISVKISNQLSVLLVQIAIVQEKILHQFVQLTTPDSIEAGFKPDTFDRYGRTKQGSMMFSPNPVYSLAKKYLELERAKKEKDSQYDENQQQLF